MGLWLLRGAYGKSVRGLISNPHTSTRRPKLGAHNPHAVKTYITNCGQSIGRVVYGFPAILFKSPSQRSTVVTYH